MLAPFSKEQRHIIEVIQPHNLLHNVASDRESINGLSIPAGRDTVASCHVEELKAMMIVRDGPITDKDGKALKKMSSKFFSRLSFF